MGRGDHPEAIWVILVGFVVGGVIALPVTVMVVLTAAAFDPLAGFLLGLAGATLSGTISFVIGRVLGHGVVVQLAGTRLHRVSLKLRDGGITAIAAVRMMPVTHFTIVSLIAGASHIRTRDFLAGTVIGMAPGIGDRHLLRKSLGGDAGSRSRPVRLAGGGIGVDHSGTHGAPASGPSPAPNPV